MPTTYGGIATNYPALITLPSDGDGPGIKAADVNVPLEGLADRTAQLFKRAGMTRVDYTAAGPTVWTPPHAGVTHVICQACGGGGGSGTGSAGANITDRYPCGGGGGGGAPLSVGIVPVTFGVNYLVTVGAGGALGANGTRAANGAPSLFQIQTGAVTLFSAAGGGGGWGAMASDFATSLLLVQTLGGTDITLAAVIDAYLGWGYCGEIRNLVGSGGGGAYGAAGASSLGIARRYGDGGAGTTASSSSNFITGQAGMVGCPTRTPLVATAIGGVGGLPGSLVSGTNRPGGGGGGGGAGPWGSGGAGGNGGGGVSALPGEVGIPGVSPAANTGAGAGGGGGGGSGTSGGAGGIGAAGASGRVELFYWGQP